MADGEVKIETKLDTSGLDKDLQKLDKKLDDAGKKIDTGSKSTKGFNTNLKTVGATALKTAGVVGGVAVAVKKTVDALNECEAAYKVQLKAETALANAAKNNPYLNSESVANLKAYASELQGVSEVGDEASIQIMAMLASTGRTEEQIRDIMSAAIDMSAITGNSLQNTAMQLNKTYSGLAGELGEANGAIKALTKEELENGKAIEIVASQYKGAAAATADTTVQLSNAWGDFKENIGKGWNTVTQPVKDFFLKVLNDINEATSKTNALKDANENREAGTASKSDTKILLDEAIAQRDATKTQLDDTKAILNDEKLLQEKIRESRGYLSKSTYQKAVADLTTKYNSQQVAVMQLTSEYDNLSAAERKEAEAKAAQATAEEKAAAAKSRDDQAAEFIKANTEALEKNIAAMELHAKLTNTRVNEQDMYNAYMESYIKLLTDSNGLVTANNSAAQARLAILEEWAKKAKDAATEEERLAATKKLLEEADALVGDMGGSKYDRYTEEAEHLRAMREAVNNDEITDEERKAERIAAIDKEMTENRRQLWQDMETEVMDYASRTNEIIQDAAALALETENNRMTAELNNLEILYRKGELSEEEYQEKVAAAKKEGAKTQYKIEMAQWASNILMATANTAVGVTQALAQGGVAGIITGALVGAAGAVQLASIMAAKPIPHYATGGFVGGANGASMGGDNTTIAARTGELVLNANQQRALWDMITGAGTNAAGAGYSFTVNNNAANLVNVDAQLNRNQIELMIDARVNDGLNKGRFTAGLNAAQAGASGEYYGI